MMDCFLVFVLGEFCLMPILVWMTNPTPHIHSTAGQELAKWKEQVELSNLLINIVWPLKQIAYFNSTALFFIHSFFTCFN